MARIILVISSREALVSSTEEACSLAPEERLWLAMETCRAAAAVCSAPSSRLVAKRRSTRLLDREMTEARRAEITSAEIRIILIFLVAVSASIFEALA